LSAEKGLLFLRIRIVKTDNVSTIGITKIKRSKTGPVFNPKLDVSLMYKKRIAIKVKINF